ncbi:MAG: hypothetical protein ACOC5J_00110 [Gemmatimonadota bacterium]
MRKAVSSTLVALVGAMLWVHPVVAQQDHSSHGAHGAHGEGSGMHGAHAGHAGAANDRADRHARPADDFAADMGLVHELLVDHESIRRTVTDLPDGVRTVTESDDPRVAEAIKEHVASMDRRLVEGDIFNVRSSRIPVIFENADKIRTTIEETPSGVVFVQTTDDPELVPVLQGHAREVDELVSDGMAAMHGSAAGGGEAVRGGANHGGADQGDGTDHATHGDAGHAHGDHGAGDHEHGEHDHGSGSAGGGER